MQPVYTGIMNVVQDLIFKQIHNQRLIYNACWEDPRLDRQLLELDSQSKVVMITSAGCNTLDYLLDSPAKIHAVDVNYRQNAVLQLKMRLIEHHNFDDLFAMFGLGYHQAYQTIYATIRDYLPSEAQNFWDNKHYYFSGHKLKKSFYYHGTTGDVAWLIRQGLQTNQVIRTYIYQLLEANNLAEQQEAYNTVEPHIWNSLICWLLKHPLVLAMLGVPRPQAQLIARQYPGGIIGYIRDRLTQVFTQVLMRDNYFWRVYFTGSYSSTCCPNYLKPEHQATLRANLHRVQTHTNTLTNFLKSQSETFSHFVLLDHQDWLAWHDPAALLEEWQAILHHSRSGSKILLRSASPTLTFLPPEVKSAVRFFPEKTDPLHQQDRVGTYGSLHLGEVIG